MGLKAHWPVDKDCGPARPSTAPHTVADEELLEYVDESLARLASTLGFLAVYTVTLEDRIVQLERPSRLRRLWDWLRCADCDWFV